MKNFSNFYIFTFASVMVIVVAALLSFVSEELKPRQLRNVEIETKTNILSSVDMTEGVKEASDQATFIEDRFDSFITESFVVNSTGEM
ncbi:MAG: NADH:ubiquinone reductase (Na(+)-transporting) subunit C, partial [Bacteroidales bacterium]